MTIDNSKLKTALESLLQQADLFEAAIHEFIEQTPGGVPEGELYAHVSKNLSLNQFTQIMGLLVEAGRVRKAHVALSRCVPLKERDCSHEEFCEASDAYQSWEDRIREYAANMEAAKESEL